MATEYFYNASTATLGSIPANWPEWLRNEQRLMFQAEGFLPVPQYTKPTPTKFCGYEPQFTLSNDGLSYQITWIEKPYYIKLSHAKLAMLQMGELSGVNLVALIKGNKDLRNWWLYDLRYLRGSPMALLAQQTFGLTQAQLEEIVKQCAK